MIFHQLTAVFGSLQHSRLSLKEGLNVIEAPNEAGKSTWCAFLRAMLYGINTRERDSKTALADKNRYLPWNGAPMEGELLLTAGGRELTIRRFSKAAPFDTCTVTDLSGETVPGLTGDTVGQALLGVGREVFERSAFLKQGGSALGGSDELERRIAALISSGEETVGAGQAHGKLGEWLRRRKHNKTGLIPKLEEEKIQLDEQLSRLSGCARQAAELRRKERTLSQEIRELNADLTLHDQLDRQEQNRRYARYQADCRAWEQRAAALRKELDALGPLPSEEALNDGLAALANLATLDQQERRAEQEARQAAEKAREARGDAGMFCFLGMTPDQAWQRAEEDAADAAEHDRKAAFSGSAALAGVLVGLVAGGALSALLLLLTEFLLPLCIGSGCALFAVVALLSLLISRRSRSFHLEERDTLLDQYGAENPGDIRSAAADYRERCARAEEAEGAAAAAEEAARALRLECARRQNEILALVRPFAPKAAAPADGEAAIRRALELLKDSREAEERRDSAMHIFALVAEQGGGDAVTLEYIERPARSREELSVRLSEAKRELAEVKEALSSALGAQEALGDPAVLNAQREEVEEALLRRREEYGALLLARQTLEEAARTFRARISPELDRRAGTLFSALTAGAYDKVELTRTFDAAARPAGSLQPRSVLALSQGTADQLYLAVRLALCSLVLPEEDPCPLVLDDALCSFDDRRMALALDTLLGLAKERQILLFTCHRRERRWLEQQGAACNFVQMGI